MSKKKNGFREWLSDNLRYVILGFAMLVILALLYIGWYFLVSLVAGTQLKDTQSIQNEQQFDTTDDEPGGEVSDGEVSDGEVSDEEVSDENITVENGNTGNDNSENNTEE